MKNVVIIRIGGSLMYTEGLNINKVFFAKLRDLVVKLLNNNTYRLALVTGGGALTRSIVDQVSTVNQNINDFNKHYLGLTITHVNKAVVNAVLSDDKIRPAESFADATSILLKGYSTIIAGQNVGNTTDMTASEFAKFIGVRDVYKLSNIKGVYDKDPNKFHDAKFLKVLSWNGYAKIFDLDLANQQTNLPGMHAPVDFKCARFCLQNNINFHIAGGESFDQFNGDNLLDLWKEGSLITS